MELKETDNNQVWEIPLDQIRPAPWNPPSRLDQEKVVDLAASIQAQGQQSPGLIRPVEAEAPVRYELVFGHRRYASKKLLEEKTNDKWPSDLHSGND